MFKKLIIACVISQSCNSQSKNELYLHADYKEFGGVGYARNIGSFYEGSNVYLNPFRGRGNPEFTGQLESGFIIWQVVPFICAGFYTCGGEAKREGEGKQGYYYGGGISGYYRALKVQTEYLNDKTVKISFGILIKW